MNARQLGRIRKRLQEMRAALLATPDAKVEPVRRDPLEKVDEDAAPLAEMLQVIASNRNRARAAELDRIDRALRRLEEEPEEFGLCRACEEEIDEKRLLAMPHVELCVDCQARRDPARGGTRRHLTDFRG
jgi:DnaK suppressor protein